MPLSVDQVRKMVEEHIPGSVVTVRDLTGTSDHFHVHVVSSAFAGKSLIDQHRMVHSSVGAHLTTTIHALQIKTETPPR